MLNNLNSNVVNPSVDVLDEQVNKKISDLDTRTTALEQANANLKTSVVTTNLTTSNATVQNTVTAKGVNTTNLTSTTAKTNTLTTDTLKATDAEISNISGNTKMGDVKVDSLEVADKMNMLEVGKVHVDNVDVANNLHAHEAEIEGINAVDVSSISVSATDTKTTTLEATDAELVNAHIENANIDNLTMENLTLEENLEATAVTAENGDIQNLTSEEANFVKSTIESLKTNRTTHSNSLNFDPELETLEDWYTIEIPSFKVATTFLRASFQNKNWEAVVVQSGTTAYIQYSQEDLNCIKAISWNKVDGRIRLAVRSDTELTYAINLLEDEETITDLDLVYKYNGDDFTDYIHVPTKNNTYLFKGFGLNNVSLEFDGVAKFGILEADEIEYSFISADQLAINNELILPAKWDTLGNIDGRSSGTDKQIIRIREKNGILKPTYEDPIDNVDYPTTIHDRDGIITERTLRNYDGTAQNLSSTEFSIPLSTATTETDFPSGRGGQFEVTGTISDGDFEVTPKDGYMYVPSFTSVTFDGTDWKVDGVVKTAFETTASQLGKEEYPISHLRHETITHGDHTINKQLKVEEDATIEGETITGELEVKTDATIHGDLFVDGTTTSVNEAQVSTSGKYIVTRENAVTDLGSSETSGLVIHRYSSEERDAVTKKATILPINDLYNHTYVGDNIDDYYASPDTDHATFTQPVDVVWQEMTGPTTHDPHPISDVVAVEFWRNPDPDGEDEYRFTQSDGTVISVPSNQYDGMDITVTVTPAGVQAKNGFVGFRGDGTAVVSAETTESNNTYTNISHFNGKYYEGLTGTEKTANINIITESIGDELANVVLYDNAFYHYTGADWKGPLVWDNDVLQGPKVDDVLTVTALNALDKYELQYFQTVTSQTLDVTLAQPIMTRAESSSLQNNTMLYWDACNQKAVTCTRGWTFAEPDADHLWVDDSLVASMPTALYELPGHGSSYHMVGRQNVTCWLYNKTCLRHFGLEFDTGRNWIGCVGIPEPLTSCGYGSYTVTCAGGTTYGYAHQGISIDVGDLSTHHTFTKFPTLSLVEGLGYDCADIAVAAYHCIYYFRGRASILASNDSPIWAQDAQVSYCTFLDCLIARNFKIGRYDVQWVSANRFYITGTSLGNIAVGDSPKQYFVIFKNEPIWNQNKTCFDSSQQLWTGFNVEWHCDGKIVTFGKCQSGGNIYYWTSLPSANMSLGTTTLTSAQKIVTASSTTSAYCPDIQIYQGSNGNSLSIGRSVPTMTSNCNVYYGIGGTLNATGVCNVSIGVGNIICSATNCGVAIGVGNIVSYSGATAVGYANQATNQYATAVGYGACAKGLNGIAIGTWVNAGNCGIAIGTQACAYNCSVAIGAYATKATNNNILMLSAGTGSCSWSQANSILLIAGQTANGNNFTRLYFDSVQNYICSMAATATCCNAIRGTFGVTPTSLSTTSAMFFRTGRIIPITGTTCIEYAAIIPFSCQTNGSLCTTYWSGTCWYHNGTWNYSCPTSSNPLSRFNGKADSIILTGACIFGGGYNVGSNLWNLDGNFISYPSHQNGVEGSDYGKGWGLGWHSNGCFMIKKSHSYVIPMCARTYLYVSWLGS